MSRRSEKFNDAMVSLNALMADFPDETKIAALSDRDKSTAAMYASFEAEPDTPDRDQELAGAILRLIVAGKEHLVPTLLLITENGDNRETSITKMRNNSWHTAEMRYYRHRNQLLDFFM